MKGLIWIVLLLLAFGCGTAPKKDLEPWPRIPEMTVYVSPYAQEYVIIEAEEMADFLDYVEEIEIQLMECRRK